MHPEQYLAERVEDQIKWYNRKGRANKRAYRTLRVLGVLIALGIPIMSSFLDDKNVPYLKLIIAVAGAAVALIEALLSLYKFRDNWTAYRNAAEALIQHKYLFSTRAAPYNVARPFVLFVQNAEGIMSGERVAWMKLNTAEEEKLLPEKEESSAAPDTQQAVAEGSTQPAAPEASTVDNTAPDSGAEVADAGAEGEADNTAPEGTANSQNSAI